MESKIKTVQDAFKFEGLDIKKLPDVSMLPKRHQEYIIASYLLAIVVQSLNHEEAGQPWEPDWNDHNQPKYYPWVGIKATKENPAGVGFSSTFYDDWYTHTGVGSRLCFKSSKTCLYALRQFEKIFKYFYLLNT